MTMYRYGGTAAAAILERGAMSAGVTIWRCMSCRAGLFLRAALPMRCHGGTFEPERAHEAVVEEISVIRHMIGQENWQPRRIANVRTAEGLHMTVGLRDESGPGATPNCRERTAPPAGKK